MNENLHSGVGTADADIRPREDWKPISVASLAAKELRETLRDRRTIVTLFLMPLLVYPILSLLFQGFIASSLSGTPPRNASSGDASTGIVAPLRPSRDEESRDEKLRDEGIATEEGEPNKEPLPDAEPRYLIVFNSEDDFNRVAGLLNRGDITRWRLRAAGNQRARSIPDVNLFDRHIFQARDPRSGLSLEEMVEQNLADVGVVVNAPDDDSAETRAPSFELIYRDDLIGSVDAVRLMEGILDSLNISAMRQLARMSGRDIDAPVQFETRIVKARATRAGISFYAMIPLILTLMTITGAVYPAIDLTAGERERGTLETLVAAPIPRMRILVGKLVAIVSVSMLTAVVNLTGMMITVWVFGWDTMLFGEAGLTWQPVLRILGLLVLFAAFFASVLLVITSFARSFKEGQAYLIPIMMVALAPGLMSLKPDLELTGLWAVTPLVNIVLLSRDVLTGTANWATGSVTVIATVFYSVLAITVAARFFGTARVLYGEDEGIGALFRRPRNFTPTASASLAMLCLAFLFPASFLWQGLLVRYSQRTPEFLITLAAAGIVVVFGIIPALLARFHRVRLRSGFNLRRAPLRCYFAAILLGLGLGPLLLQAIASSGHWIEYMQPRGGADALVQHAEAQAERLRMAPWPLVIFCFAVVPAIFEELFFRGLLFRALRLSLSATGTVLVTGVMFAGFHLITTSGLGLARVVPTLLMGFALGWLCYKSGSAIPGMILHGLHNTLGLSAAIFQDAMVERGWIASDQSNLPLELVAVALILAYSGFAMLYLRPGVIGKPGDGEPTQVPVS